MHLPAFYAERLAERFNRSGDQIVDEAKATSPDHPYPFACGVLMSCYNECRSYYARLLAEAERLAKQHDALIRAVEQELKQEDWEHIHEVADGFVKEGAAAEQV